MKRHTVNFAILIFLFLAIGACHSTKDTSSESEMVELSGQVYVWLTETAKVSKLEYTYEKYELKSKGPASRTERKYLFYFNPDLIATEALIQELEEHPGIEKAEVVKMKKS